MNILLPTRESIAAATTEYFAENGAFARLTKAVEELQKLSAPELGPALETNAASPFSGTRQASSVVAQLKKIQAQGASEGLCSAIGGHGGLFGEVGGLSSLTMDDDLMNPATLAEKLKNPAFLNEKCALIFQTFNKPSQRSLPGEGHVPGTKETALQALLRCGEEVRQWIDSNPTELGNQREAWGQAIDQYQAAVAETEAYAAQVSRYKDARETALRGRLQELNKGCVAELMGCTEGNKFDATLANAIREYWEVSTQPRIGEPPADVVKSFVSFEDHMQKIAEVGARLQVVWTRQGIADQYQPIFDFLAEARQYLADFYPERLAAPARGVGRA